MNYLESLVRITEALSTNKFEKDREFIKDTISFLMTCLDREDDIKKLEERVQSLETKVSFVNREQNRG